MMMMPSPEMKQRQAPVVSLVSDYGAPEEIRQLNSLMSGSEPIRSAYYGVRDLLHGPLLVRYSAEKEGIYFQEPVQHQDYGITDEDLREGIRQDSLFAEHHGISRITPDISRKLQILYFI
jgi:hypothetical protein